jgi:hypothetical protein
LWWGWNGAVTEEVIIRDLDTFRSKGIRMVTLEAGYGMKEPYLSAGWFELVKIAIEQARRRGMKVWLVDEGKYPSGFAGGKFSTERPDLRMQGLVVAEKMELMEGQTLSRKLSADTVGVIAINTADETARILETDKGQLEWTAPVGKWRVLLVEHQFRTSPTRAVNNPPDVKDSRNSLCDYLNPEATRQFLEFTHEQYKKYVGDEFGKTILGFRGDEPDYSYMPWTPAIVDEFRQRKGYDVSPYLALFFAPRLTDEVRRVKADYWDVWSNLFSENFFRVQADWCAKNNLDYMVHLNHEDDMPDLVRSEGDFFRCLRDVQVPGIDAIWNQIWPGIVADFPKYGSSAAHLFGRQYAFTESFAAYRTRPDPQQARWVINQQLVRGINLVEFMAVSATSGSRGGLRGWMASEEFPGVVAYVHRACYLLSQGRPAASIALYCPTTSLWLGDKTADISTLAIARQLLERQRDFDFVDDDSLASTMTLDKNGFRNLSGQHYKAVIIPSVSVISKAASDRLKKFASSGGRVIFLGRGPAEIADKTFLKAGRPAKFTWGLYEPSRQLTDAVMRALPEPDMTLEQPCPAVKYVHRHWRNAELYMVFNENLEKQSCKVTLAGEGQARLWNPATGNIEVLAAESPDKNKVCVLLHLEPYETKYIVVGTPPDTMPSH